MLNSRSRQMKVFTIFELVRIPFEMFRSLYDDDIVICIYYHVILILTFASIFLRKFISWDGYFERKF